MSYCCACLSSPNLPLPLKGSIFTLKHDARARMYRPYVAKLRKLSEYCNFGTALNDMLRDRLVCSIMDQRIQRRLLAEPDLTLAKALELTQAAEAAEWNTQELVKGTQQQVHKLTGPTEHPCWEGGPWSLQCYRCGGSGTNQSIAASRTATVTIHCGKKGHLAKVYRSRLRKENAQQRRWKRNEHTM